MERQGERSEKLYVFEQRLFLSLQSSAVVNERLNSAATKVWGWKHEEP